MTYTLTRSRRKTLAIHVKPDGTVEVRSPLRLSKSEIERFVASKSEWIEKTQARIALQKNDEPRELPAPKRALGEFEAYARDLVDAWGLRLGALPSYVGIRAMSSRWGSCTAKTRRIRLNSALAYCPDECIEYVIVHELAHLIENNHSPRFWAIVADALPDYKARRKTLKDASWLLK